MASGIEPEIGRRAGGIERAPGGQPSWRIERLETPGCGSRAAALARGDQRRAVRRRCGPAAAGCAREPRARSGSVERPGNGTLNVGPRATHDDHARDGRPLTAKAELPAHRGRSSQVQARPEDPTIALISVRDAVAVGSRGRAARSTTPPRRTSTSLPADEFAWIVSHADYFRVAEDDVGLAGVRDRAEAGTRVLEPELSVVHGARRRLSVPRPDRRRRTRTPHGDRAPAVRRHRPLCARDVVANYARGEPSAAQPRIALISRAHGVPAGRRARGGRREGKPSC